MAAANYTRLEVSLVDDTKCTRAVLSEIARKYDLKSAGFETMECMTTDAHSAILQLR